MSWRFVGAAALLVGCVGGGDTSDAATMGSLGGPCFANGTCNTGLVCGLVNGKGVCQESDAGGSDATVDQTVDQSVADTSTSDVSDATSIDANDACTQTLAPSRACAQGCGTNSNCCELDGTCSQTPSGCPSGAAWPCQTRGDCTSNMFCCANGITFNNANCPPIAQMLSSSQASCSATCQTGTYATCLTNGDCPSNTPTCIGVNFTQINTSLGICM